MVTRPIASEMRLKCKGVNAMEYKSLSWQVFQSVGGPPLSAIADPDVEAIVPFAIDLLDIDAHLSIFINHTVKLAH